MLPIGRVLLFFGLIILLNVHFLEQFGFHELASVNRLRYLCVRT